MQTPWATGHEFGPSCGSHEVRSYEVQSPEARLGDGVVLAIGMLHRVWPLASAVCWGKVAAFCRPDEGMYTRAQVAPGGEKTDTTAVCPGAAP